MSTTLVFHQRCQTVTDSKQFGLCDKPHPSTEPAYIDEENPDTWIAEVENRNRYEVTFTAVDHCIPLTRNDGKMAKRCDGILTYNQTAILVELKDRLARGPAWINDGEKQLRAVVEYFDATDTGQNSIAKKAFIANKAHPEFKENHAVRMARFLDETGYVLRVEGKIVLE